MSHHIIGGDSEGRRASDCDNHIRNNLQPVQELRKRLNHCPLRDDVFILQFPRVTNAGVIIIPDRATFPVYEGHVLRAGPDATVKENDVVIWAVHAETELNVDGMKFAVVPQGQIIGIIKSECLPLPLVK